MENGALLRTTFDGPTSQAEDNVFPIFSREAVHNETKSVEAGRPIYDTVETITILIPGDNKHVVSRRVHDGDKLRFGDAWARFKREEEMSYDGTPVESWPALDVRQVAALKHMNFFTVEAIASCSDANLAKIGMGAQLLRDRARAFIDAAKTGGAGERLVIENSKLKEQMNGLSATIDELRHMIEKMAKDGGKVDVTTLGNNMDSAMSHARQELASQPGDLPEGWADLKTREAIDLCAALNFAVKPRNRDEAISLLREYQTTRDVVRKK